MRNTYPHGLVNTKGGVRGNAALSRWPVMSARVIEVSNYLSPTIELTLSLGTQTLTVITAHPTIPSHDSYAYRNEQLQRTAEHFSRINGPKLLIGDLNAPMWSPYFQDLLQRAGLRNGREGFGILPTWPRNGQLPAFRIPLDHCLVSPQIRVEAFRLGSDIGSDHLPIIVDIIVDREGG